jgi:hypothetical protein
MGFSLNPLHDLSSVLHTGEKIIGDGAKGFKDAMDDAANVATHMSPSEIGHTVLNVAGMVPVIGAPADAINAGWYAAQGDWANAALSAATAIPGLGDVVGGARLGATALKIGEDGVKAERLIKDGTEAASTAKNAEKAFNGAKAVGSAGAEAASKGAEAAEAAERASTAGKADLALTYKPGWTASQKAEADAKVQILDKGDTVVTAVQRSGTSAARRYESAGGKLVPGADIDHAVDLQLGGSDTVSNMWPLNSSVNRSLGSQIHQQIKDLPVGTVINRVTIGPR